MRFLCVHLLVIILVTFGIRPAAALDWTQEAFPDQDWMYDRAEFGFGDGDETTQLTAGWTTYYFRYSFDAEAMENASTMILEVNYDDAFVAYINGLEVARSENMPAGLPSHQTEALWDHEGGAFEIFDLTWLAQDNPWEFFDEYFLNLSVEIHQVSPGDEDLTLAVRLLIDDLPKIHHNSKALYWPQNSRPAKIPTDPITCICRPLINIPAIVERGQDFQMTCRAPSGTSGWQAHLISPSVSADLNLTSLTYDAESSLWTLQAQVGEELPMGLYHLAVNASGGISDTTKQSVKVIDQFKDDFYFIHLTDTHIPERGSSTLEFTEEIIEELNIINPEFVLLTGDYVNRSFKDQIEIGQLYLERFDVPVYLTSGNHDIGDGMEPWWQFFGWPYLNSYDSTHWAGGPVTQDYSFDYGNLHLVAPMTWVNYNYFQYWIYGYHSMISSQLDWLHQDLSGLQGDPFIIMFYHYDFGWYDENPQMPEFFNAYDVDLALWGHTHHAAQYQEGPTLSLSTAAAQSASGGFRLLRFQGGQLAAYPHLWNQNNITLDYLLPNDGTSPTNTATIVNSHNQDFPYAMIRFQVPSNGEYLVTGGDVVQILPAGDRLIYEVQTEVPRIGQTAVTIEPQTGIEDSEIESRPDDFILFQNHPNPFNSGTTISFTQTDEQSRQVTLKVYNISAQEVATLVDGSLPPGQYTVRWDGRDDAGRAVASGLYVCGLKASGQSRTMKMILMR